MGEVLHWARNIAVALLLFVIVVPFVVEKIMMFIEWRRKRRKRR